MSRENVEIVRRGFDAWQRGDVAAMLEITDTDLVVHRAPPQLTRGPGEAREGFVAAIAGWFEGFDEVTVTAEEFIDANDAQVIVRTRQRAVGSESRVPVEADFWMLHTLQDRKVSRLDIFAEESPALEAAGLAG